MMERYLLLTVRFHGDGHGTARFHGMTQEGPEWPPSPARLFQALVAGIARGRLLPESILPALKWLEGLPPPVLASPIRRVGQSLTLFVPNNDADTLSDPRDVSGIRTKKIVHPSLFPENSEFLYAWPFSDGQTFADLIVVASRDLYQLGRGVDPAWAIGDVLESAELEVRLGRYSGKIYRPQSHAREKRSLACPVSGSLSSLIRRHGSIRLQTEGAGRKPRLLFSNAPKAVFLNVAYSQSSRLILYELRDRVEDRLWPWSQTKVVRFVEILRTAAVARLQMALPEYQDQINTVLVGRKTNPGPLSERVQIIPLPSIGSEHADRGIRRFVLEIPNKVSLPASDIEWAFSGLEWEESVMGRPSPFVVVRSENSSMLDNYLEPHYRWRSVTPVALPENAARRRIEPSSHPLEVKTAQERLTEEGRAVTAVHQALRHAGVHGIAIAVHVQREPFHAKEQRVEAFSEETRFNKHGLWHVEIAFDKQVSGPLVIGDGRFLGLGIMAPVHTTEGVYSFSIGSALGASANPTEVAQALRRALMSRVQSELGPRRPLPGFFSGHQTDGKPLHEGRQAHLAFVSDFERHRILIISPHLLEGRQPTEYEKRQLDLLDSAIIGFTDLRAGASGRFRLFREFLLLDGDPLFRPSRNWASLTEYVPTRFSKRLSSSDAIVQDLRTEFVRRGVPQPTDIHVHRVVEGPRGGLRAKVGLRFQMPVNGPLLLGRTCHMGGGVFIPTDITPHEFQGLGETSTFV